MLALVLMVWIVSQGGDEQPTTRSENNKRQPVSFARIEPVRQDSPQAVHANHAAWGAKEELRVAASPWSGEVRNSSLHFMTGVAWCPNEEKPSIERVDLLKKDAAAIVTVYVAYPAPQDPEGSSCLATELLLTDEIDVGAAVAGGVLYDGVQWPPIRRWPTRE